jgi:hypothetical protein
MATFEDQLAKKRIKTLAQDVLNQPQSTGQLWDTLGLTQADIEAPNFWDPTKHALQTNDEVLVRLHDPVNDAILEHNALKAICAYSAITGPFTYASQLYLINPLKGEFFLSGTIKGINASAGVYALTLGTADPVVPAFLQVARDGKFHVFFDGEVASQAYTVGIYKTDGSGTVVTSGTIPAGSTRGFKLDITASLGTTAFNTFTVKVTATAPDDKLANVQVFAIMA